jgi:hypothetical protein
MGGLEEGVGLWSLVQLKKLIVQNRIMMSRIRIFFIFLKFISILKFLNRLIVLYGITEPIGFKFMKFILKAIRFFFIFSILTALTQVGGVIYFLYVPFSLFVKSEKYSFWKSILMRSVGFSFIYVLICLLIIPPLAKKNGRVPLPFFSTKETPVKSGSLLMSLMNRNYVKLLLQDAFFKTAKDVQKKYSSVELIYLDANFPFFDGFPLIPHLSHDDGEKLDIAFFYKNKKTEQFYDKTFSITGYGVCEEPRKGEKNQPKDCEKQGNWPYNFLEKITFAKVKEGMEFDEIANRFLLQKIMENKEVKKVFIEPHLQKRLKLGKYKKIKFHGCHAVRHDDHIHFQL